MSLEAIAQALVGEYRARPTPRAGSLIITVFGDSIAPRGGSVWLGSLIRTMREFGIGDRLVRTSVFRLSRDGWLQAKQIGRRSFYRLTGEGAQKFAQATHRIYAEPKAHWSGDWCLVLLSKLDAVRRETVRRELSWLGFGTIATSLVAHPAPDSHDLDALLERLRVRDDVVVMNGRTFDESQDGAMRDLVRQSWNLDEIDGRYKDFVAQFRPIGSAVARKRRSPPDLAFQIRTLMIHEYRRILLRDPLLPAEMLPGTWHGKEAYRICRNLYRRLFHAAERFVTDNMETVDGPLPPASEEFYERFGGLN